MNWDLTYLFKTEEDWKQSLEECMKYIPLAASFKGKLNDKEKFVEYLKLDLEISNKLERTYQYASLKSDLNKKNVENAKNLAMVQNFLMQLNQATSWVNPEILSIGKDKVMEYINSDDEIKQFSFIYEQLFHENEHILDAQSEQLISYFSPLFRKGSSLYSALSVSDNQAVEVELENKEKVMVTQGSWRSLIADSKCAADRKKVFEAIFNYYEKHKTTYAEIYNGVLQTSVAKAKARKYDNVLESYLYGNNIPTSVFLNLVDVASNNNEALKKYIQLRKQYLGLEEHYTYDRFLELAHSDKKYTYQEAKEIFFDAIKQFPEDFQEKAKEVLREGFVDVYEQDGKRSGAYSSSMSNLHPFILLNYSNTLDDVFTVAHEAGHSIHSMYSSEAQPTVLQNYTIFVAEIASTFNEHVLLDYFMNQPSTTKEEKIGLLQKAIDEIYATFYRQTLFANYEYEAHKLVENNQPINYQVLCGLMEKLYKQYYGLDITKENVKSFVWAYIPHLFYTPFYVYQYATSFAASFKIYKDVKEGKEGAFDKYIGLLKAGGSKYPVEEAKDAGVDFTKQETFMAVVERLEQLVAELEKLINE